MEYRKKPVVIEAIQFNGENTYDIYKFMGKPVVLKNRMEHEKWDDYVHDVKKEGLNIYTLEGTMKASLNDYIIKGVQGEFYPCKPDIFEKTYENVDE